RAAATAAASRSSVKAVPESGPWPPSWRATTRRCAGGTSTSTVAREVPPPRTSTSVASSPRRSRTQLGVGRSVILGRTGGSGQGVEEALDLGHHALVVELEHPDLVVAHGREVGAGAAELVTATEVGAGEAGQALGPVGAAQGLGQVVADVPDGEHGAEAAEGEERLQLRLVAVLREGLAEVVELGGGEIGRASCRGRGWVEGVGGRRR